MRRFLLASLLLPLASGSAFAQEPTPLTELTHPIMACVSPIALNAYLNPHDWRRSLPGWQAHVLNASGCMTLPAGTPVVRLNNLNMLSQVTYPTAKGQSSPVYVATIELGPPHE